MKFSKNVSFNRYLWLVQAYFQFLGPIYYCLQISSDDWWKRLLFYGFFHVFFWTSSAPSENDGVSLRTILLLVTRTLKLFDAAFWWEIIHGNEIPLHNDKYFVAWTQTSNVLCCRLSLLERSFSCPTSMGRLLWTTILRFGALLYF